MTILQTHYKSTVAVLLNLRKNPLDLQIAIGWARKRYGSQLTPLTIDTTQNTLGISPQQTLPRTHLTSSTDLPQTTNRPVTPLTILEEEEDFPKATKPPLSPKLSLLLEAPTILDHHVRLNQDPLTKSLHYNHSYLKRLWASPSILLLLLSLIWTFLSIDMQESNSSVQAEKQHSPVGILHQTQTDTDLQNSPVTPETNR